MRQLIHLFLFAALISTGQMAKAHYSHMDTGEFLELGKYQFGAETQFVTSGNDGMNILLRARGGWTEELNWSALLGAGTTDFTLGGFVKWVPIPDLEEQPAIGVVGGLQIADFAYTERDRTLDGTEISLRAHPFMSKSLEFESGRYTPYGALPMGWRNMDGANDFSIHMALGMAYKAPQWDQLSVIAELGMNLNQAFSYFTIGATVGFDPEQGWIFP